MDQNFVNDDIDEDFAFEICISMHLMEHSTNQTSCQINYIWWFNVEIINSVCFLGVRCIFAFEISALSSYRLFFSSCIFVSASMQVLMTTIAGVNDLDVSAADISFSCSFVCIKEVKKTA
ncbi:unnamed protein product [Albugo candida]|uniref:Uncharacterized protein n=1 Tax=Albugo candida TaxID=65357 RepID=A0A024GHQ6_9STRA|nr:unnamed protein product [Albugo candida]|eukprot:CCI46305.1 unnamed protein product [Albugo candida]